MTSAANTKQAAIMTHVQSTGGIEQPSAPRLRSGTIHHRNQNGAGTSERPA